MTRKERSYFNEKIQTRLPMQRSDRDINLFNINCQLNAPKYVPRTSGSTLHYCRYNALFTFSIAQFLRARRSPARVKNRSSRWQMASVAIFTQFLHRILVLVDQTWKQNTTQITTTSENSVRSFSTSIEMSTILYNSPEKSMNNCYN